MVRLLPPFLRTIIGSGDDSEPPTSIPPKTSDPPQQNQDVSEDSDDISDLSSELFDPIKGENMEGLEITSNIATIASIDWGPPKLTSGILDEVGNTGKYLFDMIRGNKTLMSSHEDLTKNIKDVPKVYESDFNVYFNQINEIYPEYSGSDLFGAKLDENKEFLDSIKESRIDIISREYFEDDYQIKDNHIFNKDLDKVPESIEFLESQLMVINNQLRELVGTHLKHVSESFVCIEELKNSFLNAHEQVLNVREIFDNLKGIYNSPVQYKNFGESNQKMEDLRPLTSTKSIELLPLNEDGTCTLHDLLLFKKRIIEVLGYLRILKGVSCTPEYIQGIVEINNMSLARIFASCALDYFQSELSKFTLANSVTLVVKDTVSNLERVSEAKFIDLSFFALTECYTHEDSEEYERSLRATLEKMEPLLVVLTLGGLVDEVFSTLKSTGISPVNFSADDKVNLEYLKKKLELLFIGFKNSNLFIINILHSVICVNFLHLSQRFVPEPSKSRKIVEKIIFKIQDSFTDGINRDYQKVTETTNLLKNELMLPTTCKPVLYHKFYSNALNDLDSADEFDGNMDSVTDASDEGENRNDSGSEDDKNLKNDYRDHKEDEKYENKSVLRVVYGHYQKLYYVVENMLKRSFEGLFGNLEIQKHKGSVFSDLEYTIETLKNLEITYNEYVRGCVNCLMITEGLIQRVLEDQLRVHNLELNENIELKLAKTSFSHGLLEVFRDYASSEGKKKVELLFEQSLVKIHQSLSEECWDKFEAVKLEEKEYNLIESSLRLNEHLNTYFKVSEKLPFLSITTISKSTNLFAYFNTLIENELEKNLCVKKLCLIIQTLDFFTILIPLKIRTISSLISNDVETVDLTDHNHDLLVVLGSNAENCVLEANLLRKKSAELLSNFIFSQIKMHLINWVFKYTDLQEDSQSEDATEDVDLIVGTVSDLYTECSKLFPVEDLKDTFEDAFDKMVDLAKKQNVDFCKFDKFSDDCTRMMTKLSHLKEIKLEVLSLAHRLSN